MSENKEVNENVDGVSLQKIAAENEKDVKQSGSTYVHKFKKPFEYEGKKYETINFYFGNLTGKDMIAIEDEMAAVNKYPLSPEISSEYLIKTAARASGVGSDVLEKLPLSEFKKIRDIAREHLLSLGL